MTILFVFTGGGLRSVNTKKWLDLFKNDNDLRISFFLKETSEQEKEALERAYPGYRFLFFKNFSEIKNLNIYQRFKYIRAMARQIDQLAPDIVHLQGLFYTYMVYPLFFLKNKPVFIFNIWGSDFNLHYKKHLKNTLLIRYLFKKADLIWTNWFQLGLEVKKDFLKFENKIKTIPWGVTDDLFEAVEQKKVEELRRRFKIEPHDYVLLYTRGLVPNSNHQQLIKAIARLEAHLKFKLIIHVPKVNPDYKTKIQQLIDRFKLNEKIIWSHDYLADREMQALYAMADLSFSLTTKEQFSQTIIESILNDCHLIVNRNPAYRFLQEVFRFNIEMVDVQNTEQLAETIKQFIVNRPEVDYGYEKMVINRLFCFSRNKAHFLQIYNELRRRKQEKRV